MDPNGFNPEQNPFEAIFAQGGGQPPPPQDEQLPPQLAIPPATGAGPVQDLGPEELQAGKTGDNTRPLLSAVQALHTYIAASADPGTIQLVRNLISALTQLVARDQKASEQMAGQQQQQVAQNEAQAAPVGAPAGPPTVQ